MSVSCTHEFSYLLKTDEQERMYTGRVLELPAVIVQGETQQAVHSSIVKATRDYLKIFADEHKLAKSKKLSPSLETPSSGIIIKTQPFQVTC